MTADPYDRSEENEREYLKATEAQDRERLARLLEELRENSESGYACAVRLGLVGGEPGTDHGMDYEAGE